MHARTQLSKAENVVNENLLFSDAHNCYWNFALQHLQNQLRDFGIFVSAVQEKWNHNKHRDHIATLSCTPDITFSQSVQNHLPQFFLIFKTAEQLTSLFHWNTFQHD